MKEKLWMDYFNKIDFTENEYDVHSIEKWEIFSHWKIISWNHLFCNVLCENVTWVNFHDFLTQCVIVKKIWVNFHNFLTQCWNNRNFLSHFFDKNFVKPTVLIKTLLRSWFHEIFLSWEWIFYFFTLCFAQCGNFRIFLSLRFYVKSNLGILEV